MSHPAPKVHYDNGGRTRCGHGRTPLLSADHAEVTCNRCLDLLAGTYGTGRRYSDVKPCGTLAAVRRHYRRGEPVDETCRQAESRNSADYYAARKQTGLAA